MTRDDPVLGPEDRERRPAIEIPTMDKATHVGPRWVGRHRAFAAAPEHILHDDDIHRLSANDINQ